MRAFYHIYLTEDIGNWAHIVTDQLTMFSKRCDPKDVIEITVVYHNESLRNMCIGLIDSILQNRCTVVYTPVYTSIEKDSEMVTTRNVVTENYTLKKLWDYCQNNNDIVFYFHTKGITAIEALKNGNPGVFANYATWRFVLHQGTFGHWDDITHALTTVSPYDIAGPMYMKTPVPHFSGGFWMARSDYIRTLPDPSSIEWWKRMQARTNDAWLKTAEERFKDEMWVASNRHEVYPTMRFPEGTNLGQGYIPFPK